MADEAVLIAHLLRRTGFGPHPGQVAELADAGYDAALDRVLATTPLNASIPKLGTKDDYQVLARWWLDRMVEPAAGLHEKMVWFWHGHLTSSLEKVKPIMMARQHLLLRKHALGNARQLMHDITIDAAMLSWLDGQTSTAEAPNENYARELMELFGLGRELNGIPNYTFADIRAAAYALSGWEIDDKNGGAVVFRPGRGPTRAMPFLGTRVSNAADVVNAVCDHPAFAPFLARKLYLYFHGVAPEPDIVRSLAEEFRTSNLDIGSLVAAIVRHPSFVEHGHTRPRFPVEWAVAVHAVIGPPAGAELYGLLWLMGQIPFVPPNVAGWPLLDRWSSPGISMAQASYAFDRSVMATPIGTDDEVAWVLDNASLFEVSDTTKTALSNVASAVSDPRQRAVAMMALTLSSPEFSLA